MECSRPSFLMMMFFACCAAEAFGQATIINSHLPNNVRVLDCLQPLDQERVLICTQREKGINEIQIVELSGDSLSILSKPLVLEDCDFYHAKLLVKDGKTSLILACNLSIVGGADLARRISVSTFMLENGELEKKSTCIAMIDQGQWRCISSNGADPTLIQNERNGDTHTVSLHTASNQRCFESSLKR